MRLGCRYIPEAVHPREPVALLSDSHDAARGYMPGPKHSTGQPMAPAVRGVSTLASKCGR